MSGRWIAPLVALLLVCGPSHAAKGVKRHGGALLTATLTPRTLHAEHTVPINELQALVATGAPHILYDTSRGTDRIGPEGLVMLDTSMGSTQREAILLRSHREGLELLVDAGSGPKPHISGPATAVGMPRHAFSMPHDVTPEQATLAASFPRLAARFGSRLVLMTDDLRAHDIINSSGLLHFKWAWEVHREEVDLTQIIDGDPSEWQIVLDVVWDKSSGAFGAPVVWLLPHTAAGLDASRSGYRVTWFWESIPGTRGEEDWFPYVTRIRIGHASSRGAARSRGQ